MGPTRLYVIIGSPREQFSEPPYPTDPRAYGLPLFKRPLSDEEFDRDYRAKVKAFIEPDHAVQFACCCRLITAVFLVYDRAGEAWVENEAEAARVALSC
jgi:hypothetical protein